MLSTTPRSAARRRSRELVLQGLYQRRLADNAPDDVRVQLETSKGYERADAAYFDAMWRALAAGADARVERLAPLLDRKPAELSPIERAILAIGAWELDERPEIPYRVVINEAVELAKSYGGTDGHKFVNGVLDRHAASVRAAEVAARAR
ncbi:MAG: transcription antitermination factor NusB [Burkholderiales bacterium]|nr:transcription antitermination factor NusB [Burkholderiales bacterium]MCE7876273.1 transcription antitermination factor NusB [Betaproteobacteria bacterium PRO3]